jgi:branched-chain amino acid transport system ATP-binding protein
MALLDITRLSVSYGKVEAVRDVSLHVKEGQIVSIIGPNGAGKTTLLLATMGLLRSTGTISFRGENIDQFDVETRVEAGLCLVPERRELFADMSLASRNAAARPPVPSPAASARCSRLAARSWLRRSF